MSDLPIQRFVYLGKLDKDRCLGVIEEGVLTDKIERYTLTEKQVCRGEVGLVLEAQRTEKGIRMPLTFSSDQKYDDPHGLVQKHGVLAASSRKLEAVNSVLKKNDPFAERTVRELRRQYKQLPRSARVAFMAALIEEVAGGSVFV